LTALVRNGEETVFQNDVRIPRNYFDGSSTDQILDPHPKPAAGNALTPRIIQVVEPSEFFRGCLAFWLRSSCPEFEIGTAPDLGFSDNEEYVSRVATVVIGTSSFQTTSQWVEREYSRFRLRFPNVPIVAIVVDDMMGNSEEWANQFGLSGYIPTSSNTEVASAVLRLVIAGGTYFPRITAYERSNNHEPVNTPLVIAHKSLAAKLTEKERAVFERLGRGSPNKVIAHELSMSLSTVKAHVHRIIQKLNVKNRTEVAVSARPREPLIRSDP
jgi:DNA-binding NarL/FixJ family response regulator